MKALKEMFGLKELGINMGSDYVNMSVILCFIPLIFMYGCRSSAVTATYGCAHQMNYETSGASNENMVPKFTS